MVVGTIIAVVVLFFLLGGAAIFIPNLIGSGDFGVCTEDKQVIPGSRIESCPDPDGVCEQYRRQAQAVLDEVRDGYLIEDKREAECKELYCPAFEAYFKCKCEQCYRSGGLENTEVCANECSWTIQQICDSYVNCIALIN